MSGATTIRPRRRRRLERTATFGAFFIALIALSFDVTNLLGGAIAGLYILVVLLIAQLRNTRALLLTGALCAILMAATFLIVPHHEPLWKQCSRLAANMIAIVVATVLSVRGQRDRSWLRDVGRVLELTHDTVVICDDKGVIRYWNDGAERLYGWRDIEAIGQRCDDLLRTEGPFEDIETALDEHQQWSGELTRVRRDGTSLVLASRRLARLDDERRRTGVIETSQNLTEQRLAETERDASEQRYSRIFHAAGVAMWESDWSQARQRMLAAVPPGVDARSYLSQHPDVVIEASALATMRDCNDATAILFDASGPEVLKGARVLSHYEPAALAGAAQLAVAV